MCILAGGRGSRLGERVSDTPKPLLDVAGEPFLLHQLRLLARNGASHVVICVGYLGERIAARIGSEQFGIGIEYSFDAPSLDGTLGAIRRARELLGERFLVLYGDAYLRLDYCWCSAAWVRSGLPALMTVFRNDGRWDVSNADFDGRLVTDYDKRIPRSSFRYIDYGLGGLTTAAIDLVPEQVSDLADLYQVLAASRQLFGVEASERFYEIGSPASLREADRFLRGSRDNAKD